MKLIVDYRQESIRLMVVFSVADWRCGTAGPLVVRLSLSSSGSCFMDVAMVRQAASSAETAAAESRRDGFFGIAFVLF